jgi:hypothetical protein
MNRLLRNEPIPDPVEHQRQKFTQETQTHATEVLDAARIGATGCMATRITEGAEP